MARWFVLGVLVLGGCARSELDVVRAVARPERAPEPDGVDRSVGVAPVDGTPTTRPVLDAGAPMSAAMDAGTPMAAAPPAAVDAAIDAGGLPVNDAGQGCHVQRDGSDDCPPGSWCRRGECVAFVGEGEQCGGRVATPERCAPELACSSGYPPNNDAPGRCHLRCEGDADCGDGRYCSSWFHMCLEIGTCFDSLDCDEAGNAYLEDACAEYGTCTQGRCSFSCGDPACRNISNIDLRRCRQPNNYAVVEGGCARVAVCAGRGVTLFESLQACTDACEQ